MGKPEYNQDKKKDVGKKKKKGKKSTVRMTLGQRSDTKQKSVKIF